jgi:hypothetical protein
MTDLQPWLRGDLIMTGFGLLVIDRTYALWVVSVKARRILAKRSLKNDPMTIQQWSIEWIERDYGLVQAVILLGAYLALGLMQTVKPELILNEAGRAGFALIGFAVSVLSSTLNSFIEKLDARP